METCLRLPRKRCLSICQGWSRHIDLGLVQEDGLRYVSMALPAKYSCDFSMKTPPMHYSYTLTLHAPQQPFTAIRVVLIAMTGIRSGISEGS